MAQFDKFTERARKVLQLAQEEAQRFNHNYIGTEHLLLGLVREGDGVAARVLNNMGVQLPKVRSAVEFIIGRGEGAVIGDIGLTPRAKKVLELAVDEGRRLNHHYIGTEHLLLGLVREGEGIAAGVLESLGVNLEKVRAHVEAVLSGKSLPEPKSSPPVFPPRIDQLDKRTIALLARSFEEAEQLGQPTVSTVHLVLALMREDGSPAAQALSELGATNDDMRAEIESIYPPQLVDPELRPRLSERDTFMLERARLEAGLRNQELISPEHVLIAIVRWASSEERSMLALLEIDLAKVGSTLVAIIDGPKESTAGEEVEPV